MSDPGFREIHLSGKHVVFLFMAGAVAFVGIFLLGVSVGRGITRADASTAQASPSPTGAAVDPGTTPMPDSTRPRPGELQAYQSMQEKGTPKPAASDATPSTTPVFSPSPSPAKPSPTANAKPAPAAPWFVVIASFSSRANADSQVAELKKKGYTASVTTVTGAKTPYRVRIGPLDDRPAADALRARLSKEGYKPFVTR